MTALAEIKSNAEHKMTQSIESFKTALQRVRTGRPSPSLLDVVEVDYYGSLVPISQVANVSLLDARTLGVAPWEKVWVPKLRRRFVIPIWG